MINELDVELYYLCLYTLLKNLLDQKKGAKIPPKSAKLLTAIYLVYFTHTLLNTLVHF